MTSVSVLGGKGRRKPEGPTLEGLVVIGGTIITATSTLGEEPKFTFVPANSPLYMYVAVNIMRWNMSAFAEPGMIHPCIYIHTHAAPSSYRCVRASMYIEAGLALPVP